jgi:hypothetical protein
MAAGEIHITINLRHKWFWYPWALFMGVVTHLFPRYKKRLIDILGWPILKYCVEIS